MGEGRQKPGMVSEAIENLMVLKQRYSPSSPTHGHDYERFSDDTIEPLRDDNEKKRAGGWKTMPFIIANETFEKVASGGLTGNITVYLVQRYHVPTITAANFSNIQYGTSNIAPIIGAFLADAFFGKFSVLAFSSVITLLGTVLITLTAAIKSLQPPSCSPEQLEAGECVQASNMQLGVLILSLVIMGIGGAGVRPCTLPFGMDQFDVKTDSGKQGATSFFNWYYTTTNAAILVSNTVVVYLLESVSWTIGYTVSAFLMLVAVVLFFVGTPRYIIVPPDGSIFTAIGQVFVSAYRKRRLRLPSRIEQEFVLYNPPVETTKTGIVELPLTHQFSFLNKATLKLEGEVCEVEDKILKPWRLTTVQRVEEVKCLIRVIPICISSIMCYVAIGQLWTFAVLQSLTMDRHLGPHFQIPPGSFGSFALLAVVIFLPLYDRLIIPFLRKFTNEVNGITLLQRLGVGCVLSILSLIVGGLVEEKRRSSANAHGGMTTPMSALWLALPLALVGIAEAFNAVGMMEFCNNQFPDQLRTVATALLSCTTASAGYLSSILVAYVRNNTGRDGQPNWLDNNLNAGKLDYYFYLLSAMGAVNVVYFMICAHYYRYKGAPEDLADIPVREEGSSRGL